MYVCMEREREREREREILLSYKLSQPLLLMCRVYECV